MTTVEYRKPDDCSRALGPSVRPWTFVVRRSSMLLALADQAAVSGLNFVTTVLVARVCGAEVLGVFTLGFTLVVLLGCVHESLVSTPYLVLGSKLQGAARTAFAGSTLVHFGVLGLATSLALAAVGTALVCADQTSSLGPVLWAVAGVIPLVLLREFCRRFAFAHLHMATALLLDTTVAVLQITVLAGLAAVGVLGAVTAHLAIGVACGVAGLLWLGAARQRIHVCWAEVAKDWGRSWSFGKWVFAGQLVAVMHGYAAHWLLAIVLGATATGEFAACLTVVTLANPFLFGIGNLLGPQAAQAYAQQGKAGVRQVVLKGIGLLGGTMSLFAVVMLLFGGSVLQVFYGHGYGAEATVVAVLALTTAIGSVGMAADYGLRALERADVAFRANLLGLGVTTVAALALMTSWGVLGAALGYLAGTSAGSLARLVALLRLSAPEPEQVP